MKYTHDVHVPSLPRGPGFLSTSPATTSNMNSNTRILRDTTHFSIEPNLMEGAAFTSRCRTLEWVNHLCKDSEKTETFIWITLSIYIQREKQLLIVNVVEYMNSLMAAYYFWCPSRRQKCVSTSCSILQ